MLISYKNVSMREVLNKTLYTIVVSVMDDYLELGSTGLVSTADSMPGNLMEDIFVFEDAQEAVTFAKKYLKLYNDKATKYYIKIFEVLVVPLKADMNYISDIPEDALDRELDSFYEIMFEADMENAIKVEL